MLILFLAPSLRPRISVHLHASDYCAPWSLENPPRLRLSTSRSILLYTEQVTSNNRLRMRLHRSTVVQAKSSSRASCLVLPYSIYRYFSDTPEGLRVYRGVFRLLSTLQVCLVLSFSFTHRFAQQNVILVRNLSLCISS